MTSVIRHGRTCSDGAIDRSASSERRIRSCDRGLRGSQIEVADGAVMVYINTEQRVSFYVPQKVGAEHRPPADLSLYPEVHLDRARSLVIRCENAQGHAQSRTKEISNVVRVRSLQIQWIPGFVLLPELKYGRNGITRMNVVAAGTGGRRNRSAGYGYGCRYSVEAGVGGLVEGTGFQP